MEMWCATRLNGKQEGLVLGSIVRKSQWEEVKEFGLYPKHNRKGEIYSWICVLERSLWLLCGKLEKSKTRVRYIYWETVIVPVRKDGGTMERERR